MKTKKNYIDASFFDALEELDIVDETVETGAAQSLDDAGSPEQSASPGEQSAGDQKGVSTEAAIRAEIGFRPPSFWTNLLPGQEEETRASVEAFLDENPGRFDDFSSLISQWNKERLAALNEFDSDFSYSRDENPLLRGRVTKIEANMAAIELLQKLEEEGRLPSMEEKRILAAYSGWGAFKEVLNVSQANVRKYEGTYGSRERLITIFPQYASWEDNYGRFYDRLRELLSEDEFNEALQSTLNAHYTDPAICHALWDVVERLGFEGGQVLEPAVGSGLILGAMPPDLRAKCSVNAVEKDGISARITRRLFPQTRVIHKPFEEAGEIRPGSQDLVITNVPFSDVAPAGQQGDVTFNLHNFFIHESLRKLKPGGLAVIITSASTMDNNPEQRAALAKAGDLLGAIRLPRTAFGASASTEVVTDILVLRKPSLARDMDIIPWTSKGVVVIDEEKNQSALINEYFAENPAMVLGRHSLEGKMYGASDRGQYTVLPFDGSNLIEQISDAIARLPANVANSSRSLNPLADEQEGVKMLYAAMDDKIGNYLISEDNELVQVSDSKALVPPPWQRTIIRYKKGKDENNEIIRVPYEEIDLKLPRGFNAARAEEVVRDFIKLRDLVKKQIAIDLNPFAREEESAANRKSLKESYDWFRGKWGPINQNPGIDRLLSRDPEFGSVACLENVRARKDDSGRDVSEYLPADILLKRTLFPSHRPDKAETIEEALTISYAEYLRVDCEFIASLINTGDVAGVQAQILSKRIAFRDPLSGELIPREFYLSGAVRKKLAAAQKAAEADPENFRANVEELEAIQPDKKTIDSIEIRLGAGWIPATVLESFLKDRLLQGNVSARYIGDRWMVQMNKNSSIPMRDEFATYRKDGFDILEAALGSGDIKVMDNDEGGSFVNEKETAAARSRLEAMQEAFTQHIRDTDSLREIVENEYNLLFNGELETKFEGTKLRFPGLSDTFSPRQHQRDVVARMLYNQAGVIAHDVGYGKTFEGILIAWESKRLGLCNKPMIICDNANYSQFVASIRAAYPQANILCSDEDSMNERNRTTFLSRCASGDYDMIVMPRSHADRIPNDPNDEKLLIEEEVDNLRAQHAFVSPSRDTKQTRQIAKSLEKAEAKLKDKVAKSKEQQDDCLTFQQLGVDLLIIDEFHNYKRAPFNTRIRNVKGIDSSISQRGTSMLIKCRSIQRRRGGKGVIGMTATPVTNTMAEAWTMLRLTMPEVLSARQVESFDSFVRTFCREKRALELHEASGKWKEETRLARFINGEAFVSMIRTGIDVKNDPAAVNLQLPSIKGGKPELVAVPLTSEVARITDGLCDIYAAYEKSSFKAELSYVPILLLGANVTAAIDPRLIDPTAEDRPGSIVDTVVTEVLRIMKEHPGHSQAIFLDRFRSMDVSLLNKLKEKDLANGDAPTIEIEDADKESGEESSEEEEILIDEIKTPVRFNLYEDIKEKLIRGKIIDGELVRVDAQKVILASDASSKEERSAMFAKANEGNDTVIIGSTVKIGVGANFQSKLIAAHHFDPPRSMTPSDLTQRNGRIVRQGNTCSEVIIRYYGMVDTAIPGVIDRLGRKEGFIAQALSGTGVGNSFEDAGSIDFTEMKGALISDKRQLQHGEIVREIKETKSEMQVLRDRYAHLTSMRNRSSSQVRYYTQDALPAAIRNAERMQTDFRMPYRQPEDYNEHELVLPDGNKIVGALADIRVGLDKLLASWEKVELLTSSSLMKSLGSIQINGMKVRVRKECTSLLKSESTAIVAECLRPSGGVLGAPFSFTVASSLLRAIEKRAKEVIEEPEQIQAALQREERNVQFASEQLAKLESTSLYEHKLKVLLTDLETLEKDMRENPRERRFTQQPAEPAPTTIEMELEERPSEFESFDEEEDELEKVVLKVSL